MLEENKNTVQNQNFTVLELITALKKMPEDAIPSICFDDGTTLGILGVVQMADTLVLSLGAEI